MRFDKAVRIFSFVFIFSLLQNYIHTIVYKYLLDARLAKSSTIVHLSVGIGTQAKLLCPVRSEDLGLLLWTKVEENGNKVLIGNYSSLVIPDNRFFVNVTEMPASDLCYSWLMIEKLREEDGGTYLCRNRWFNRTFVEVNLQVSSKVLIDLKTT